MQCLNCSHQVLTTTLRVSDDDAGGGKNAKIVSKLSPEHD